MPALVALFTLLLILLSKGDAHPVAQGAMDIAITEKTVRITARVANEQAFVEAAFGAGGEMPSDHAEIWKHHGEYLLQHVRAQADNATLPGTVVGFRAPDNFAATARITYELEFTIPPGATPPRAVTVTQDVLNEFEFVPGNRWEATYVVRIGQNDRPAREGLLFTSTEPLIFTCDWSATQPGEKAPQLGKSALFDAYFHHGMMHILTGYDHLLFMAALSPRRRFGIW